MSNLALQKVADYIGCKPEEIAWREDAVSPTTKAYIGPLFPGIFQQNIEHVYTNFPKEKIKTINVVIGKKTKQELKQEITEKFKLTADAEVLLNNDEFTTTEQLDELKLVVLSVEALGFENGATKRDLFDRALALGLDLCPAEVAPHLRLQYTDQAENEWLAVAMNHITGSDGRPNIFYVWKMGGKLGLSASAGESGLRLYGRPKFVFVKPQ